MKAYLILFIVCILFTKQSLSQQVADTTKAEESEMNVDLPEQTEGTELVDRGRWQLGTGLLYNRYQQNPSSVIGRALLRYGLLKRLELRLLVEDGKERDTYIEETVQSIYPLAASAKISLLKDVKGLPDVTLIAYLKLPFTSHSSEQKAYWSPTFVAAFENKFSDKWKIVYNVGAKQNAYDTEWQALGNLALHYKLTQKLELAAEYYAAYQPGENPSHNVGGNISYQAGKNVVVYINGGSTIFYEEQNHFFETGFAFRFP